MTQTQRKAISKRRALEVAVLELRERFEYWRQLRNTHDFTRIAQAAWGNRDSQREARQVEKAHRRLRAQHERVQKLMADTEAAIAKASPTGVTQFDCLGEQR